MFKCDGSGQSILSCIVNVINCFSAWWVEVKGFVEIRSELPRVSVFILGAANVVLLAHFLNITCSNTRLRLINVKGLIDPALKLVDRVREAHLFFFLDAPMRNIKALDLVAHLIEIFSTLLLIEVDQDHGPWIWCQKWPVTEGTLDRSHSLRMRRVKHKLRHCLCIASHVEVVHEHISILPSQLSLNDFGELQQGLQILERGLVDQLIGGVKLLVDFVLVGDMDLIHLIFIELKGELNATGLGPEDIVADVMHIVSARVRHVRDLPQLREQSRLQVSVDLSHHCLSVTIGLNSI